MAAREPARVGVLVVEVGHQPQPLALTHGMWHQLEPPLREVLGHQTWPRMQEERLRVALSEVYAYYSGNEAMVSNVLRDAALDPIVQETMVSFDQYWETVRDVIADAFEASGERHEALLGAIALAQDFQTWRTLVRQQELSQDQAVELMVGMVRCLMRS